ncbi:MAG: rod shape-determining protein RodA [Casimicrobium sp.]
MIHQIWSRLTDRLDPFLFAIVTAIAALGLLVLFSATNEMLSRVVSQSQKVVIAVAIMILIANLSPQFIARFAVPLYVIGIVLLVGVAVGGEVVKGARRWLKIPGVGNIQPSEIMKIALPLILAWYFERHEGAMNWRNYAVAAILVAIPFGLVYRQPDLGTALLIGASGCFVLYLAGLDWRIIILGAILAAVAFAAAWHFDWLHDYQKDRVLNFISPEQDVQDAGWHTVQAAIAIGSGGIFGKGWLQGTQTHLEFLPEKHTDFIFAVYGEEFGLLGGVVLVILYLLFIGRCFLIAANASTLFGRLIAGSMTLMFFTYAFVNIGMVTGMLPVVGVPLPFMSFGGTALMTLFIAVGILMSVQTHRKLVNS